jgi:hypothetical protein
MKKIAHKIEAYFHKTEKYSIPRMIGEFVLLDVVLTFVLQIVVFLFLTVFIVIPTLLISPKTDVNHMLDFLNFNQDIITEATSHTKLATYATIFAVIVAPIMETAIFQVLPITLLSFFTKKRNLLVMVSACVFALAHVFPLLILYILPGGILLAWTYVMLKGRIGWWKAFLVTAVIHGLFNLINLIGAMIIGY